jgi:hypothetical protein
MHRSFRHKPSLPSAWVIAILAISGCASHRPESIPHPIPSPVRRGSLAISNGIRIRGSVELPTGFVPDAAYGPIWLEQGTEVGVAGTVEGRSALLGFSGPRMASQRIIAEDFGVGAPHGRILGVAVSPIGAEFATAIAEPAENRVEVVVRNGPADGDGRTVAMIAGAFAGAQLKWIDATTIAIALKAIEFDPAATSASGTRSGYDLDLIKIGKPSETHPLSRLQCGLTELNFSSDGRFAVAEGDAATPPALIDLRRETCAPLKRRDPIRVIAWAPDDATFLYYAPGKDRVPSIFRYDRLSGESVVVAIASGAAAYTADGTIIALGNERLTWRTARTAARQAIAAKIARWTVDRQELTINSLGFDTTPELLAQAAMVFAPGSDDGLIDIVAIKGGQSVRELIEYSYAARAAFVLATTSLDVVIGKSWSPDGKLIALVETTAQPGILTVIAPPR